MVHIYPIIYLSIYQVNEFTYPTLEESEGTMVWGSRHDKTIKQPFLRGECPWKVLF
jgi:hypothetical protein